MANSQNLFVSSNFETQILAIVDGILCEPKVPSQYPIFYLSPHFGPHLSEKIAIIPTKEDPRAPPMITNRMSLSADPENPNENMEVTQFHSQDALGRFVYGFHAPDQVRMESRDHDGTVRGSYSYVDPYGNIVKMQYWDDGNGFHTTGNNVVRDALEAPQYTPEVQAARDEHFRLYKQALAVASALANSENKEEDPLIEFDINHSEDDDGTNDDSTIIGGEPTFEVADADPADFNNYPTFSQELMTPNHVLDDERDSISLENPDLAFRSRPTENFWFRKRKSFDIDKVLDTSPEVEQGRNVEKILAFLKGRNLEQGEKPEDEDTDSEGEHSYLLVASDVGEKQIDYKNGQNIVPSLSYIAKKAGSIPIAAVHDVQVSPFQRENIENHQLLPVFTGRLISE